MAGKKYIHHRSEFVQELQRALGLPERVTSFSVHVKAGKPVVVDCTYFPTVSSCETAFKRYRLVEADHAE